MHCPVCSSQKNVVSLLVLRQINIDRAVYLCEDQECAYPEGHSWIIVRRSLDEMYRENRKQRKLKKHNKTPDVKDKTPPPEPPPPEPDLSFNIDSLIEAEIDKLDGSRGDEIDVVDLDSVLFADGNISGDLDAMISGYLDTILSPGQGTIANCDTESGTDVLGELEEILFSGGQETRTVLVNDENSTAVDVKQVVSNSCSEMKRHDEQSKVVILEQLIFN